MFEELVGRARMFRIASHHCDVIVEMDGFISSAFFRVHACVATSFVSTVLWHLMMYCHVSKMRTTSFEAPRGDNRSYLSLFRHLLAKTI